MPLHYFAESAREIMIRRHYYNCFTRKIIKRSVASQICQNARRNRVGLCVAEAAIDKQGMAWMYITKMSPVPRILCKYRTTTVCAAIYAEEQVEHSCSNTIVLEVHNIGSSI